MNLEDIYWDNFMVLILDRMVRSMRNEINDDIEELGVNCAQAPYLLALQIKDGQTMASLSNFLEVDRANTSRMIKSLETMGAVRFERNEENIRNVPVYLTDYGRQLAVEVFARMVIMNKSFFEDIPEADCIRFRNTLIRLFRNVHEAEAGSLKRNASFYKDLRDQSVMEPEALAIYSSATRKVGKL